MDDDEKESAVGYGTPPKEHRFKKGTSGNPKGRPKKSRWRKSTDTLRVEFIDQMEQRITIQKNGRSISMPAVLVLYEQLLAKACKGDFRSAKLVLDTYFRFIEEDEDARVRLVELLNDIEAAQDRRMQERASR